MSKQLAVSAAFSILMMAAYVLFGGDSVRQPVGPAIGSESAVQISMPDLPEANSLLPSLH